MAAPPDSITTPLFVGWLITVVAFLGNIFWNISNRRYTTRTAEKIHSRQFRLDEWATVRSDINGKVTDFEERLLHLSTAHASNVHDLGLEINREFRSLLICWDRMCSALRLADKDDAIDGKHWEALGSGPELMLESCWDRIASAMEIAKSQKSVRKAKDTLSSIKALGNQITDGIAEAVRVETQRYNPEKV